MKQRRVVLTPEAMDDLADIYSQIAIAGGMDVAASYIQSLRAYVNGFVLRLNVGLQDLICAKACAQLGLSVASPLHLLSLMSMLKYSGSSAVARIGRMKSDQPGLQLIATSRPVNPCCHSHSPVIPPASRQGRL
jgi:hypothetical protein